MMMVEEIEKEDTRQRTTLQVVRGRRMKVQDTRVREKSQMMTKLHVHCISLSYLCFMSEYGNMFLIYDQFP